MLKLYFKATLLPIEVTKNDDVFDQRTRKFYELKEINYESGIYKLGVTMHGMVKVEEFEFVNCR